MITHTLRKGPSRINHDSDQLWEDVERYSIWNHGLGENENLEDEETEEFDSYDSFDDYTLGEGPNWRSRGLESVDRFSDGEPQGFLEKPSRRNRKRFSSKRRRR